MLEASKHNVAQAGVTARIGVALADAGYASQANFDAEGGLGMRLLVSTSKRRNVKTHAAKVAQRHERDRARIDVFVRITAGVYTYTQAGKVLGLSPGWTATQYRMWRDTGSLASPATVAWQAMTNRLAEPANKALYKQRSPKIEGSYAHIKTHRGITAFTRHGLKACRAEWNLINLTGNLMKLHKKRHKTPPTTPNNRSRHRIRPIHGFHNVSHHPRTRIGRPGPRIRRHHQPIHHTT
jgi:hypothetical protein